jgi:heptosyltransferase-2
MQRMAALVALLVPGPPAPLRTDVGLSPAEEAHGERELERRLPRPHARSVLLHLSSPEDVRGWPARHWSRLARELAAAGRGVLIVSGPAEEGLGRELARELAGIAGIAHWCGQRGLRELAAVLAAAARRRLVLVACDSGPMHLAAAHGLAVLALEGPEDAARTGPWPPQRHRVVRNPSPLLCAPCTSRRCSHPSGPVCMSGLAVEAVRLGVE